MILIAINTNRKLERCRAYHNVLMSAFVSNNHFDADEVDDADDGAVAVADGWIRQPRPLKVVDAAQGQALGLIKRRYRKCSRRDDSPVFY